MIILVIIMLVASCSIAPQHEARVEIGPETMPVEFEKYQSVFYVSDAFGSDETGDGSHDNPWETIQKALASVTDADADFRCAILIGAGDYSRDTFEMIQHVDLYGGFDSLSWARDIYKYPTELQGDKKRRIIIGADNALLDGFIIKEGRIRGKGAGVFCDGVSPVSYTHLRAHET